MVVITADPWEEPNATKQEETADQSNPELFGFQDLASDYYQVYVSFKFPVHTF
jgi:hypothetical protein